MADKYPLIVPEPKLNRSETDMHYRAAIRDINAQGVLKTFFAELYMLMHEYDMHDSIFGEKVNDLMNSYHKDMGL